MRGIRHLPLVVLLFLLGAAGMTMVIGWMMSREERLVVVEQDAGLLNAFSSGVRKGVDSLEKNFDRTLLDLCRKLDPGASDRRMVALAGTYAGVRQVSVVQPESLGREARIEKSLEVGGRFPLPVLTGRSPGRIDPGRLDDPGVTFFWEVGPGNELYFVTRQVTRNGAILVLGIDRDEVAGAISKTLGEWANKEHQSLVSEGWIHRLVAPDGTVLADHGEGGGAPEMIYPISSSLGDWQIQVWNRRERVVDYRESVLKAAGAVALGFLVVGLVTFSLLRRSLMVAEQRVSFVNQVSHELRTPMTNMMLNLDLAKEAVGGNRVAGRRLGLMGEELKRLHRLLENVLTFSASREGRTTGELEEHLLAEVIRQTLVQSEARLHRQGIKVEIDLEEGVKAKVDRDGLMQILENLVSNVVKYGGEGGELLIRSFTGEEGVVVQVVDSGPGISGRHRKRIFRPFSRLSRRVNEGVSGSGLGLAISRDLARSMKGRLVCKDRPDGKRGSCFELVLPGKKEGGEIVPFETKAS